MSQSSDLRALTDELDALRAKVDAQADELTALRSPSTTDPVSRRHMLRSLAGLGAAGVAGVAMAEPAGAADGDSLVLGEENVATSTTLITTTKANGDGTGNGPGNIQIAFAPGLFGLGVSSNVNGIVSEVRSDNAIAAVWGDVVEGAAVALLGQAREPGGLGVVGETITGPAIAGSSNDGVVLFLEPAQRTGPPTSLATGTRGDRYPQGAFSVDDQGDLWICTETGAAGQPGTWTRLLREDNASGRTVPVTPFRALDTRATGGRSAGAPAVPGQRKGPLTGGATLTLDLAGVGPLPDAFSGIVGNVTIITPNYSGFLRVMPKGATSPASSTNFTKAINISNAFTSGLATPNGSLSVRPSGSSIQTLHLVIDIAAYIT